jgi:hypothetical protein
MLVFLFLVCFQIGSHANFAWTGLELLSSYLWLLSSWDYRFAPPPTSHSPLGGISSYFFYMYVFNPKAMYLLSCIAFYEVVTRELLWELERRSLERKWKPQSSSDLGVYCAMCSLFHWFLRLSQDCRKDLSDFASMFSGNIFLNHHMQKQILKYLPFPVTGQNWTCPVVCLWLSED